jgi:hypothetical protein
MVRTGRQRDGHLGYSGPVVRVAVFHQVRAMSTRRRHLRPSSLGRPDDRRARKPPGCCCWPTRP